MQDNKPLELKNVKIDDIVFPFVQVYGLSVKDFRIDHDDKYGYGESATVITDIDFDIVSINIFGREHSFDVWHDYWQTIEKQVKEHIFDDRELMQQWQDREFAE